MKTLVNFGFYLLSENIPFGFLGRKIGPLAIVGLLNEVLAHLSEATAAPGSDSRKWGLIKSSELETISVEELVNMVEGWRAAYLSGAVDPIDEIDASGVEDSYDSFMIFIITNYSKFTNAGDVLLVLEEVFLTALKTQLQDDGFAGCLLSTMHQSRGLERENVFLINESDWERRVFGAMKRTPRKWHWWKWQKECVAVFKSVTDIVSVNFLGVLEECCLRLGKWSRKKTYYMLRGHELGTASTFSTGQKGAKFPLLISLPTFSPSKSTLLGPELR